MIVERFKAKHLERLDEQQATAWLAKYVKPEHARALEGGVAYTGSVDGKILVCAGIIEYWPGRGEAWAYLAKDAGSHFLAIHHAVRSFLFSCPMKRIEAAVDTNFIPGHRWVHALGFRMEARIMESYFPEGRDASLYAKVK